jgi:hypothetical protein
MTSGRTTTLLDLVWAVTKSGLSENDAVATITRLINSGQVRLCGNFAGERIKETASNGAASSVVPTPSMMRKAYV